MNCSETPCQTKKSLGKAWWVIAVRNNPGLWPIGTALGILLKIVTSLLKAVIGFYTGITRAASNLNKLWLKQYSCRFQIPCKEFLVGNVTHFVEAKAGCIEPAPSEKRHGNQCEKFSFNAAHGISPKFRLDRKSLLSSGAKEAEKIPHDGFAASPTESRNDKIGTTVHKNESSKFTWMAFVNRHGSSSGITVYYGDRFTVTVHYLALSY